MTRVIVLVDHGSRRDEANQSIKRLGQRLATALGANVRVCHMELAEPSFEATLSEIASSNEFDELCVLPLFFSAGRHYCEDIEQPIRELARTIPTLKVWLGAPLSEEPLFVDLLARRIDDIQL